MGMNLDELVANCESAVKKTRELKNEIFACKEKLAKIIEKNYNDFIAPIAKVICRTYEISHDACPKVSRAMFPSEFYLDNNKNLYLSDYMRVSVIVRNCYHDLTRCNFFNYGCVDVVEGLSCLGSVDDTMKIADKLKEEAAKRIGKFANLLDENNAELSATLSNLKAKLEGSPSVEQVSENTVRVQIGGKTYIGTLEEN